MTRLSSSTPLPSTVRAPGYRREAHGFGIVHLGVGAFHRAHQALYTEDALEAEGGDWRTIGVSLRSAGVPNALNPQDGLYTVVYRGNDALPRVVGNIGPVLGPLESDHARIMAALADPAVRVISLTVTEKGYGRAAGGGLDMAHPSVAADKADAERGGLAVPRSVPGLIAAALVAREASRAGPVTVLSCDNLAGNGEELKRLVAEMLGREPDNVTFPATMIDRITPASTDETRRDAAAALGVTDEAAIETEPFTQFVVEDDFADGRPAWEAGGAVFVDDVGPHEMMKLRMLNGAHSFMAYLGQLHGLEYVRDVSGDPQIAARVNAYMAAAQATLPPVPGVDLSQYAKELMARYRNPAIAHRTRQIAMDGTQKLPQRIFAPALKVQAAGGDVAPFAEVIGLWMAYAAREAKTGTLDDPLADRVAAADGDPAQLAKVIGVPEPLASGPFMEQAVRTFANYQP